jgi:protocatechuate 3,4-dioxygenase beta subunit
VLQAAAEDRFAVDALLANVGAGQSASGLKLTLHEVGHVDGVVVDPDGSALANVRVYAVRGEGREDWQPTDVPGVRRSTNILVAACGDAQGRFALGALPRDTLTIRVGVAPYLPWSCTLVPDGQSLRIALDAGATLMGTVRSADGQPLRGAILQTTANGGYRQLTDAQGTFRFVGVPPSRYAVVTVEAEGHVSRVLEGLVVSADRDNTLDVRLERELCIAGCVIKADGHALAHAAVDIRDDTVLPGQDVWDRLALSQAFQSLSGDQRHGFATTYTDDDGHFRFERLQAHHFQLRVGERPQLFSVMSGEESLVLQLACPEDWRRRLLGTVVDAETGQSIEDFEVSGQYDCTGPVPPDPPQKEGNRFIFDLYTGRVHVTVSAPDHEYWFGTFDGEEGRDHEQAIRLQPARRVTVSVVDEHGKALPKCDVSISCRGQPVKFAVDGCMCRGSASLGRSGRIVVERLPRDTLTIGILKSTGPGVRKLVSTRVIDLSGSAWTDELEFVVAADR